MDKKLNVPFSPPDITDSEINEVVDALKSGWITTGPKTKLFEKRLAEYFNAPTATPNCICLNSQTACAELTLSLLGIGPQEGGSAEDEVITCAFTYTASASVVCHVGAKLVLIDCRKDSPEIDYDALEKAIGEHTKAIIPVDIAGIPCDYDRIFDIVEKKKKLFRPTSPLQKAIGRIAVVEDAAHAVGTEYKGKKIGTIADFTNFSFHAVKNLTTAEGGALVWKTIEGISDEDIYHKLQLFSLHGQSKDALSKNKPGMWEYDVVGTWYKYNMTDLAAAVGLKQLERYPAMLQRRKDIIAKYDAAFKPLGVKVLTHYSKDYEGSGHLYIARIPWADDQTRRDIITAMGEEGIACNVHYKPLPMHTAYKNLGFDIKDFPNAYDLFVNEITLPLHTCLTDEQVDYVIETFKKVLKKYAR